MNEEVPTAALPLTLAEQVDQVCNRFEAEWQAGRRPRIEDYLDQATEPGRSALLRELLASELEGRGRRGERPTMSEYRARFPEAEELIAAVFAQAAPGAGQRRRPRRSSPARIDTGRNLLFGLLALQNTFIDRDALLDGFNRWVADRTRTLGQILLERDTLSPSRHRLLEAWSRSTSTSTAMIPSSPWPRSARSARCATTWPASQIPRSRPAWPTSPPRGGTTTSAARPASSAGATRPRPAPGFVSSAPTPKAVSVRSSWRSTAS